jgi:hypothetical protein
MFVIFMNVRNKVECLSLASPTNIRLGWKGLPETNTTLLQTVVNYGHKKFYDNGPRGQFYKLFYGRH